MGVLGEMVRIGFVSLVVSCMMAQASVSFPSTPDGWYCEHGQKCESVGTGWGGLSFAINACVEPVCTMVSYTDGVGQAHCFNNNIYPDAASMVCVLEPEQPKCLQVPASAAIELNLVSCGPKP